MGVALKFIGIILIINASALLIFHYYLNTYPDLKTILKNVKMQESSGKSVLSGHNYLANLLEDAKILHWKLSPQ